MPKYAGTGYYTGTASGQGASFVPVMDYSTEEATAAQREVALKQLAEQTRQFDATQRQAMETFLKQMAEQGRQFDVSQINAIAQWTAQQKEQGREFDVGQLNAVAMTGKQLAEQGRQFDLSLANTVATEAARQKEQGREFDINQTNELVKQELAKSQFTEGQRQFNVGQQNYQEQIAAQKAAATTAGTGLSALVNEYNKAFTEAKGESEQRYQQMLGIADTTTQQRAADIRAGYAQQGATSMQNLQRMGMANTTLAPTMQQGLEREQSASLNRLADEMQKTKLGILQTGPTKGAYAPTTDAIQALLAAGGQGTGVYGSAELAKALSGLSMA